MNNLKNSNYPPKSYLFSLLIKALSLLILCLSFNLIIATPAVAKGVAKNVIILIIDGLRNDESFDDPTHQYIPHIWNDLAPQGTINTNFWNTGWTITTPGHTQIVTGVRAFLNNEYYTSGQTRSKYPNIFEYYRKSGGFLEDNVWVLTGKGVITKSINTSLHPDYADFGASRESLARSDANVWSAVQQKMDIYHPSLMLITLGDVDKYGHKGDYLSYVYTIRIADQIAYDLWQKIQSDPYYKDNTDLIITTDHGRDSDGYGRGFISHGRRNHGNRHLLFLALGLDFKQNQVVDIRRDQIDLAPTVGAILGFQTPYADGEVMTELFVDPSLGSDIVTGGQRRVSLSASGSGLHLAYSQKNGQEWDIYYKKSLDGGDTWTDPVKLFENGQDNNYFYEAKITSQDNGLVYAATIGYSLIVEGGDTYTWKVFGRRSLDGGNTWEEIQKLKDAGGLAAHPSISSMGDNITIIYSSMDEQMAFTRYLFSSDKGTTFEDNLSLSSFSPPGYCSLTNDGERFYGLWTQQNRNPLKKLWNVFFNRTTADYYPLTWGIERALTSNYSDKMLFFMNNAIAVNNSGLIKTLITSRQDQIVDSKQMAGKWITSLKSGYDLGNIFINEGAFYDQATSEAWNPKVSFIDPGTTDVVVIWEQHVNNSGAEIYGRKWVASGWQSLIPISSSDGKDSAEPDLAIYNNTIHVGWQDYENGNWQIKTISTPASNFKAKRKKFPLLRQAF